MSFAQKKIDVAFTLASGNFPGVSENTVTLSGYRASVTVVSAGTPGMEHAQIRVFGVPDSLTRGLATYGAPVGASDGNIVQVLAGDDESGMSIAFEGFIQTASIDLNHAPDGVFNVMGFAGSYNKAKPATPTSFSGSGDAAAVMAALAKTMGYAFENNGVSVQLADPYFEGSAWDQADECARAGNFYWVVSRGTLAIWPRKGFRAGAPTLISPETGMVGYPTYLLQGVQVKTLYTPEVRFGSQIQVQSSQQPACGVWTVLDILTELEAETPGGAWFQTYQAYQVV